MNSPSESLETYKESLVNSAIFSLEGRVALVTGGNSGLGRAIALGLRMAGAQVTVTGRNPAKNAAIAEELGDPQTVFVMDVQESEVARTIDQVAARYGRLDILVNNAGTIWVGHVVDNSREDWDAVLDTNLTGPFLCAKHAARAMIARGEGGKIVNIGSLVSMFGPPDFASYAASKAGMRGLTHALAVEFAPYNIQVNTIEPGYFVTDMSQGLPDWLRDEITRKTPAGRFGRPEELVGAAILLASHASDFMTGSIVRVDGGYAIADRFRHD
ncbi:MAG: SDR family oxidoreductase [Anaerolineae bacterium]|nr:SDR family oxidoreductase [Anaerolineae bacterium]